MIKLPIAQDTEWPIAQTSPYGDPDGAWGFSFDNGFKDASGNGLDLTNYGLQLTAKGGFKNDGTADRYAISPSTWSNAANSPISYNFWAKHKHNAAGNFRCPFCIDAWSSGIGVLFQENDIRVLFYGKGATPYVSSYTAKRDAWNMVSFIYDGSIAKCFVNGVNIYTSAAGETLSSQTNKAIKMLHGSLTSTYNFTDEVRGLQIEKSVWDDSVIPMLYERGYPDNSPAGAWGLNTNKRFQDVSGNGKDGTNAGQVIIEADGGFNNIGAAWPQTYVATTLQLTAITGQYTFNWWAYNTSYVGSQTFLGGSNTNCIQLRSSTLNLQLIDGGSGGGGYVTTSNPLVANKWQNITATYDAPNNLITFYVDGVSVGSGTITPATFANSLYLWIMASYNGQSFAGRMKGITVRPVILSLDEIQAIYNEGVPVNRANELFFSHNMSEDLSVNNVPITVYGGAIVGKDGLICNGSSGGASVANFVNTGDITAYFTLYNSGAAENNIQYLITNTKFACWFNYSEKKIYFTSDGATSIASAALASNVPYRICIIRAADGAAVIYANAISSNSGATGTPVAGGTPMYFGNISADSRTLNGLLSDSRINSGIDTYEQILADNEQYGF